LWSTAGQSLVLRGRKRVDDALKILGTDYIDVLVLRKAPIPEQSGTSLEDTAKAMKVHSHLCAHEKRGGGL